MRLPRLEVCQRLALSSEAAWTFFSDPANLASITPPGLAFEIASPLPATFYPGLIVSYRIRPLVGAAISWTTEITHLRKGAFFVDEQRFGPFRFWHHQHHFLPCAGGVEMTDLVHYRLPLGPVGQLFHRWLIEGRLQEIFAYRREILAARFGELP